MATWVSLRMGTYMFVLYQLAMRKRYVTKIDSGLIHVLIKHLSIYRERSQCTLEHTITYYHNIGYGSLSGKYIYLSSHFYLDKLD